VRRSLSVVLRGNKCNRSIVADMLRLFRSSLSSSQTSHSSMKEAPYSASTGAHRTASTPSSPSPSAIWLQTWAGGKITCLQTCKQSTHSQLQVVLLAPNYFRLPRMRPRLLLSARNPIPPISNDSQRTAVPYRRVRSHTRLDRRAGKRIRYQRQRLIGHYVLCSQALLRLIPQPDQPGIAQRLQSGV
jgi:hypothetical protein